MRYGLTVAVLITIAGTALSFARTPPRYITLRRDGARQRRDASPTFSPPAESALPGGKFGELVAAALNTPNLFSGIR